MCIQWDQIWRNLATLANFKKFLANFLGWFNICRKFEKFHWCERQILNDKSSQLTTRLSDFYLGLTSLAVSSSRYVSLVRSVWTPRDLRTFWSRPRLELEPAVEFDRRTLLRSRVPLVPDRWSPTEARIDCDEPDGTIFSVNRVLVEEANDWR